VCICVCVVGSFSAVLLHMYVQGSKKQKMIKIMTRMVVRAALIRKMSSSTSSSSSSSSSITLYHCFSSRSVRALWTLEELGLKYTVVSLPFPPRVFRKQFKKELNPMGTVPFLVDSGTEMTESSAICHYLAQKYPNDELNLLVSPDENDFPNFLDWMYRSDATLTFPQTLYLRYSVHEPDERKQLQVAKDYETWFLARARTLETFLEKRTYLCSNRFTIADIAVGYALLLAEDNEVNQVFTPNIKRYWNNLKMRPAFLRIRDVGIDEWGKFPRTRRDAGIFD
jgi:glutathione S-transferase